MWSLGVLLYMLVSGHTPFKADTNNCMFRMIKKGDWDFKYPAFRRVSDSCKDLILKLLEYDPRDRITG